MRFQDWISEIIKSGLLCSEYANKVDDAKGKSRLMDLCLDSNGVSFLCEMGAKGMPFPYESILREFKSYINGRYIGRYYNKGGKLGYTSSIYCCFSDSDRIDVQTTLCTILGCKSEVYISENDFVKLYVDSNCELAIHCPITSRCIVECWGNAKICDCLDGGRIDVVRN